MAHMVTESKSAFRLWLTLTFSALFCVAAVAEEFQAGERSGWMVTPLLSVAETLTDNAGLGVGSVRNEQISEIRPGLRVQTISPRISAYFDYQLQALAYAKDSRADTIQHSLNSFGSLTLAENFLFIDFSGAVAQQSISAFGTQSTNDAIFNPNRTETASFSGSPYIQGRLFGTADYKLRYLSATTNSKSNLAADVTTHEVSADLQGVEQTTLGWSFNANQRKDNFDSGVPLEIDRTRAFLFASPSPELRFSINAGRESNNYSTLGRKGFSTHGYDVKWSPGPRTSFSLGHEKRFFGSAQSVSFSHRTRLTVWRYAESKDVSVVPNQFSQVGLGNIYDLLFSQLSTREPDPVLRAQEVNARLQSYGIPANTPVTAGFLSSRISLQRQRTLSAIIFGARSSFTVLAQESESEALTVANAATLDDFANASKIRQRGVSVSLSHRITPQATVQASGQLQRNEGQGLATEQTKLRAAELSVSRAIGPKLSGSLAFRKSQYASTVSSYRENVLAGVLSLAY
jgi:uncharacterized protein (PEP-CTERM system associated)